MKLVNILETKYYIINQLSSYIVLICAKQPESYKCNVWHDLYMVLARALYEG